LGPWLIGRLDDVSGLIVEATAPRAPARRGAIRATVAEGAGQAGTSRRTGATWTMVDADGGFGQ